MLVKSKPVYERTKAEIRRSEKATPHKFLPRFIIYGSCPIRPNLHFHKNKTQQKV